MFTSTVLQLGSTGQNVRTLQSLLSMRGASIAVDGEFGPRTQAVVRQYQSQNGLIADGIVGPATWAALQGKSPPDSTAASRWPTLANADRFYGDPRNPRNPAIPLAEWERANLTTLANLPFEIRFDGQPVRGIRCHVKVVTALSAWLQAVWKNAGQSQYVIDQWGMSKLGGSYVYRPIRGGLRLSSHAYGAAFDFDPSRNWMHDKTPHFATLRNEVVRPFLDLGGTWGGDWDGDGSSADERRPDGMHFEFIDPSSYRR